MQMLRKFFRYNDEDFEKYDYYLRALAIVVILVAAAIAAYSVVVAVEKSMRPTVSLKLQALSGPTYNTLFNKVMLPHAVVLLYRSDCGDCEKQFDFVLKMKNGQKYPRAAFFLVSLDNNPLDTIAFLNDREITQADEFALYYVPPSEAAAFKAKLTEYGAAETAKMPLVLITDNTGRILMEYANLSTPVEMEKGISILRRKDPNLSRQ